MMRPKRNHVSLYSFAGALLILEMAARLIAPSLPVDPGKWPRIEIAQKLDQMRGYVNEERETDVVFVGSSMMAGGVDPVAFNESSGFNGYNAAFAGPSMRTVTPWVLDIVEPLLEPEVVVVGIQSRELSDNGPKNEIMSAKFLASPGYKEATSAISRTVVGGLERVSYLLRYRRAFREPTTLFEAEGSDALAETEVRHEIGPWGRREDEPGEYHARDRFIRGLYENTLKDFEVGGPEYRALLELQENLEARDVRLVVVNMPVTDDYWRAHVRPKRERAAYRALIARFVRVTRVAFIDAQDAFPETMFRDPMHLDVEGRRVFAGALAEHWARVSVGGASHELDCSGMCTFDDPSGAPPTTIDGWACAVPGRSSDRCSVTRLRT